MALTLVMTNGSDQNGLRRLRYREMLDFYQGSQWEKRKRPAETRLTINYARALVRKVASYMFPQPVIFNVATTETVSDEQARRAEAALNDLHTRLDLHSLDFQTVVDAAVLGDGAFKVTWDSAVKSPLVTSVDPTQLDAWSAPDNVREVVRVRQSYRLSAADAAAIFKIGTTGNTAIPVLEEWTAETFTITVGGEVVRSEANPYGWIPYVIFANNGRPHELWGESDLVDLIDLCRELNQRMTVLSRILQVSGNPIVVLENVSSADGIRADPGQVWELPEDSKAYLLDMLSGGGVRLHIDYIEALYRALYDLAETPRSSFGDSGRNLSGAALEIEIQPLIQKVQRKRRTWDGVYRKRNAMLLDLMERFGHVDVGGVRSTSAIWPSILPADRSELARTEVELVAAGIHSRESAVAILGDEDPQSEFEQVVEERRALDELGAGGVASSTESTAASE